MSHRVTYPFKADCQVEDLDEVIVIGKSNTDDEQVIYIHKGKIKSTKIENLEPTKANKNTRLAIRALKER